MVIRVRNRRSPERARARTRAKPRAALDRDCAAPTGGVTQQGVVLTELQSLMKPDPEEPDLRIPLETR